MKQYIPLGEVITKATVERCGGNQFPILSITMKDGLVLQDEKFKKRIASVDTSDYKVIPRGKLVQGIHIDEANFGIQDIVDAGIVSPAYKVWDVNDRRIFPKYLEIIMRSPRSIGFYKSKLNGSVNRRGRMTDDDFLGMLIPVVDYSEQIRIVDILNRVKVVITKREHELSALDDLIKARFVEMFGDNESNSKGWKQSRIGDCCTLKSGTSLPAEVENEGGPIPYVKVGDMNYPGNERYITTSSRYVSSTAAGNGLFAVGSILFPKRGGAIGTNKKRMTKLPICADLNIMGVSSNGALLPEYLLTYFDMIDLGALSDGSSVPQINNKNIAPLLICLPPLELQREFASFVYQIDKSKSAIQKSLDETQLLFDSLMQKYFG